MFAGCKIPREPPLQVSGADGPPDILLQGCDGDLVKAHRSTLSHATDMFSSILSMETDESQSSKLEGIECLWFEQPAAGRSPALVIPLCYNTKIARSVKPRADDLFEAYKLAHRFGAIRRWNSWIVLCTRGNFGMLHGQRITSTTSTTGCGRDASVTAGR